jgi:hypothetical protein
VEEEHTVGDRGGLLLLLLVGRLVRVRLDGQTSTGIQGKEPLTSSAAAAVAAGLAASSSSSLDSSSLLSSALAAAAGLAASSSSEESSSESESDASAAFYIHQYLILGRHSTSTHNRGRDLGGRNSIRARVVVRLFLLRVRVLLGRAWLGCGLLGSLLRLLLVLSHVRRDPEWTTRMGQI